MIFPLVNSLRNCRVHNGLRPIEMATVQANNKMGNRYTWEILKGSNIDIKEMSNGIEMNIAEKPIRKHVGRYEITFRTQQSYRTPNDKLKVITATTFVSINAPFDIDWTTKDENAVFVIADILNTIQENIIEASATHLDIHQQVKSLLPSQSNNISIDLLNSWNK